MNEQLSSKPTLSPWWRRSVLFVFVVGMIGLIFMSVQAYRYAPPIIIGVVPMVIASGLTYLKIRKQ